MQQSMRSWRNTAAWSIHHRRYVQLPKYLFIQVLHDHYQRATASKHSMEIEQAIEDRLLTTPVAKKTQDTIRRLLAGEEESDYSDEDEEASEVAEVPEINT